MSKNWKTVGGTVQFSCGSANTKVHKIGDKVWIAKHPKVIRAIVKKQEWWDGNPDTPVYYDLVDRKGKVIGCPGSGNWHFQEVWDNEADAVAWFKAFYEFDPQNK